MRVILLAVLNSALLVVGQTLWKLGVNKVNPISFDLNTIVSLLLCPYIIEGIIIYAFTTILWLYVLSLGDFSFVYPIQGVAFIFALIVGVFVFKENINISRWLGVILVCIGIYFITK